MAKQQRVKSRNNSLKSGIYPKGRETVSNILDSAERILIENGYQSLSIRRVAQETGITAGNLQYYFPTKDDLIKALLDKIIQVYLDNFERLRHQVGSDPDEQFAAVITLVVKDLNLKTTSHFFPEVWALANHEDHVSDMLDDMYNKYRDIVQEIIQQMNPSLTRSQARKLSLFVTSSIEGHTIFIGHKKPWKKDTNDIIKLAVGGFTHLIHNPTF